MIWIDRLRLVFAALWVMIGVAICVSQAMHPDDNLGWVTLGGVRLSLGWAALLLGGYNLVRWWASRAARAQKQREAELAEKTARHRPRRPEEPPAEPDPNFDFSDRPPAAGDHGNGAG